MGWIFYTLLFLLLNSPSATSVAAVLYPCIAVCCVCFPCLPLKSLACLKSFSVLIHIISIAKEFSFQ